MNEGMQNLKEIQDLENKLKDRYTITEIISVWAAVYGEDMMVEYPDFIKQLQATEETTDE